MSWCILEVKQFSSILQNSSSFSGNPTVTVGAGGGSGVGGAALLG